MLNYPAFVNGCYCRQVGVDGSRGHGVTIVGESGDSRQLCRRRRPLLSGVSPGCVVPVPVWLLLFPHHDLAVRTACAAFVNNVVLFDIANR